MKYMVMRFIVVLGIAMISQCVWGQSFEERLKALPYVESVEPLKTNNFREKYLMKVRQNVDGKDENKGVFTERVFVSVRDENAPTVMVTEGYQAGYAMNPNYEVELSAMYQANLVCCEYRYFDASTPTPCNYDYLTVDNSMNDLHRVRQTLGQLFTGKWIATGVSKGGQTTMFYRVTYPDDVDVSVSYVAPLNRSVEDGRHEIFLAKQAGTKSARKKVLKAQKEILKRRDTLQPMLERLSRERGWNYYIGIDSIYDFVVLEYPFALFQYGSDVEDKIPDFNASDEKWFRHVVDVNSPDYFAYPSKYLSFDVQAARELGYYGYSTKHLRKWLHVKDAHGYLSYIMLPPELRNITFDPALYNRTVKYLTEHDPQHLFIYGSDDPWSASGVCTWLDCSGKQNMRVYVQPGGNHGSHISTLPETDKNDAISRLNKWLGR